MGAGGDITFWIAFSAGILSFFSPCVLPLIPSYLTYITGLSFGQLQEAHPGAKVRLTVLFHSLAFIAGFSAVFISLGALAGIASSNFQDHMREGMVWVQRVGGVLIFLFGVHMSGLFHFGVLLGEKRVQIHSKPSGFVGTFLVGLAFAAGWTPCIGPILGAILALAAGTTGNAAKGVMLLAVYSAGLGVPFLVSGLLFHSFLAFFNRFRKYIRLMEIFTGVLLMVVGVMLFFNLFGRLSGYLYQWLPVTG
ncbi:MAG: cytochrome C biogenesis protein [Desulfuromonas sp.]|uniref:cytochrome c biogenesis CcdA family protein n=1 Tax=Desulfuromonas sp. TaxID=892 RepID=UPI000CCA7080|nr:cytochrome c biogenesis protein CcdA [Desulfuromonas sp.]PLX86036.1 MAG: cytochrome C biogenesis protein [Desulfuromonas sp.]